MHKFYSPLLAEQNLLKRFSSDELKKKFGFTDEVVSGLENDSVQGNARPGFLGALVLNFLSRQGMLNGEADEIFLPAYTFSEHTGIDLSSLLDVHDNGRQIVVEKGEADERDMYISVKDLHLPLDSGESDSTLTQLANRYFNTGSFAVRNELIEKAIPFVTRIAGLVHTHIDAQAPLEDLVAEGVSSLFDVVEKFDPALSNNATFETYAAIRVRGAIIDSLRRIDMLPRQLRQRIKKYQRYREKYMHEHSKEPSKDEFSDYVIGFGESFDDEAYTQLEIEQPVSLYLAIKNADGATLLNALLDKSPLPLQILEDEELSKLVRMDLKVIPEKARKIIEAYVFQRVPLVEAAALVGVSESRACQLCSEYFNSEFHFCRTKEYLGIGKPIMLKIDD
ncbi:sigma-70 family RNA polymerase sigma factor [Candidatus Woesearchaeota archaeon]|nr:sigma-70 family RNA polymerase sigma factor [Candidatus Woesearchaeota archaeon]